MRLALCPECKHGFVTALPGTSVFCERCGQPALVSDGTPADVFKVFNEAFPTATPRKVKQEVWRLAQRVASREITAREALELVNPADEALKGRTAKWIAILTFIAALVQLYQGYVDGQDAQRNHAELMGVLGQIQSTLAETAHAAEDAEANSAPASEHSPLALRGRSGDASKPRKRAAKSKRKK